MGSIQDKVDSTCEIMLISIPDPNCLKKTGVQWGVYNRRKLKLTVSKVEPQDANAHDNTILARNKPFTNLLFVKLWFHIILVVYYRLFPQNFEGLT